MLNILEKHLTDKGVFKNNIPEIVDVIANSIPNKSIPYKMKLAFAMSEIITFTSQFHRNIQHWNGSSIPVNAITFCIAKSGAAKDSSLKAARKCFKSGYEQIEQARLERAKNIAIEQATDAGLDAPTNWNTYKAFYITPNPLFVAPSTTEGFIQHLNDLTEMGIGAGYIFSGEVGAELSTNTSSLTDNIRLLAELYDEGTKEVKILKDRNAQSKEIVGIPVSAMFMGSQDNLLYEDNIKKKFRTEFTTKLARRSFFIFANEDEESDEFSSIEELLHNQIKFEDHTVNNRQQILNHISNTTPILIKHIGVPIKVSDDVRELHTVYQKYNEELSKTVEFQYPMTKLSRAHLQWKALKLSGALALVHGFGEITIDDYKAAISFLEIISKDIQNFEKELVKESYEIFAQYCQEYAIDGRIFVNLHTLRKMGYISTKGNPSTKMKELVQLVTSYDSNAVYKCHDEGDQGITYEKLYKTPSIHLSYVECSGNKEQRKKTCDRGYICEETDFKAIGEMLQGDYAYSPFKFTNGIRGKENIESLCKWVVLDVDSAHITDEEAHILLSDINHYVVRTSDINNTFKFRIIIELDAPVEIESNYWTKFIQSISKEIGVDVDLLPKAQIFFSYSNRNILSVVDQEPLAVKNHVINAYSDIDDKIDKQKKLTTVQKSALLQDPMNTFAQAYYAKQGEGSRKMIWAAKYAKELGASKDQILDLMEDINNYWISPMPKIRFENTIISQIQRWSF